MPDRLRALSDREVVLIEQGLDLLAEQSNPIGAVPTAMTLIPVKGWSSIISDRGAPRSWRRGSIPVPEALARIAFLKHPSVLGLLAGNSSRSGRITLSRGIKPA